MRNPWGDENEWKGKWCDTSDAWTAELREQYKMVESKPDGRFFMPFSDFLENFEQVSLCYYREDYFLSSFEDQTSNEYMNVYKFTVEKPGEYYVLLSQKDQRAFPMNPDGTDFPYSCNGIMVCTLTNGHVEFLGGKHGNRRDVWIKANVPQTEVYVFVTSNWEKPDINNTIGLGVYGVAPVRFQRCLDS